MSREFRLTPNSISYELKALRRAYSISSTSWECEFGTPVYDRKGVKTRWRPAELAICSYLGTRVRHSVAIRPDYHSAYLASLIPDEWDIDAHEYTSCYGRFVNDNFSPGTINCKLQSFIHPATGEMQIWVVA